MRERGSKEVKGRGRILGILKKEKKSKEVLLQERVFGLKFDVDTHKDKVESGMMNESDARCRVIASSNNTKVVRRWYDEREKRHKIASKTAGERGYKNAKRGTVYAAQETAAYIVKMYGSRGKVRDGKGIHVRRYGMGQGRAGALSELEKGTWVIRSVSDGTKDPHNGCRRKKKRRI